MSMAAMRRLYKVVVTHPEVPIPVLEHLRRQGCETVVCKNVPPVRAEVLSKVSGADAILWAHYDRLNAEILDAAGTQLKAVSTMSSGIDYVDLNVFKQRQILLGHTPGVVKYAVADLAVGLMLAASRWFHAGRQTIENSQWQTGRIDWLMGQEIRGSVIGFFGFGGIGKLIAERLQNWQIEKVIYTSHSNQKYDLNFQADPVAFDQLLAESDFLLVAAPLTDETRGIFDERAFSKMKPNCVFVNVGRGGIVNQPALYNALKTEQIFAAGLDVMTPEPLPATDQLLTLPNCIILPHLGTQTTRTTTEMGFVAANNILNALNGKPMISPAFQIEK